MKISRKSNSKKRIFVAALGTLLVVLAGYFGYLYFNSSKQTTPSNDQAISKQPDTTNNTQSDSSSDNPTEDSESETQDSSETSKPVVEPKSTETKKNDNIATPTILSATQTDSGHVRVSASFTETANGTCQLTLKKAGESTITKTAEIIVVPSGYACDGFKVSVPSEGGWSATVTHIYKGSMSQSASMKVE